MFNNLWDFFWKTGDLPCERGLEVVQSRIGGFWACFTAGGRLLVATVFVPNFKAVQEGPASMGLVEGCGG